ncbi:response regulator transcription factor [Streptomyces noursei]|nr:response regulator transcription factor [Streptomyces noursei]
MHRVLVVADDPAVATAATAALARAGHTTAYATDGFTALELAADFRPHVVVLDPALPGIHGLGLRRRLRSGARAPVPVVSLTAGGGAAGAAAGRAGAPELVARVAEALRRAGRAAKGAEAAPVLRAGDLTADPGTGRAARAGRELSLTADEFALLVFLMRHPGRVFSREQLLRRVWGRDFGDLSAVAALLARLRTELAAGPDAPGPLTEVWGPATASVPGRRGGPGGRGRTRRGDGAGGRGGRCRAGRPPEPAVGRVTGPGDGAG